MPIVAKYSGVTTLRFAANCAVPSGRTPLPSSILKFPALASPVSGIPVTPLTDSIPGTVASSCRMRS